MRTARLHVVLVSTMFGLAGGACADPAGGGGGDASTQWPDGGYYPWQTDAKAGADAVDPLTPHDGPAPQPDGPVAHDGPVQFDAPVQNDAPPVPGCAVQNVGVCDPVCQNCPSNKRCTLDLAHPANKTMCVPAGTVGPGGACSYDATTGDTCKEGSVCLDDPGKCMLFCRDDDDCAAVDGLCIMQVSGFGSVKVCYPGHDCNPLAQTGCPGSKGCYYLSGGFTSCETPGTGGNGAACNSTFTCKPGFVCISSEGKCRRMCGTGHGCPDAAPNCYDLVGSTEDYGVCMP
jgi:hypothetical protein